MKVILKHIMEYIKAIVFLGWPKWNAKIGEFELRRTAYFCATLLSIMLFLFIAGVFYPPSKALAADDSVCVDKDKRGLLECLTVKKSNIEEIWKSWTVYLAGFILIVLYTVSFCLWSYSWALMAKLQQFINKNAR